MPYRWLFPTVQLFVCLLALWPVGDQLMRDAEKLVSTYDTEYRYRPAPPPASPPAHNRAKAPEVIPEGAAQFDIEQMRLRLPTALNLPALIVQLPYIVVNPEQKVWRPQGMSVEEWNEMFLPFAGLIFWWSAGRGLEAFLASRHSLVYPRISWLETIAAFVMCVGGAACVIAISASPLSEREEMLTGAVGFALWSALSIPVIIAKILQIRLDRITDPYYYY